MLTMQVLKMDVEGHEPAVIKGGMKLLQNHRVWFIIVECNIKMIGADAAKDLMTTIIDLGYRCSGDSFKGPWFSREQAQAGNVHIAAVNLYCTLEQWFTRMAGANARRN